jgi:catechol 2,3-dioxygenase-like lactoylglutathione lyase family enzyme
MPKYEVNHTHLTSANPKATVEFYTQKLGGKITAERMLSGNQPAWDVDLGGLLIRISAGTGADDALKTKQSPWTTMRAQYGLHHLALTADNLDEAVKDLKAKGVEFILEPKPGSGPAFIMAPDGVLFELIGARPR